MHKKLAITLTTYACKVFTASLLVLLAVSGLCCRLKIPRRPEWHTDMSPEVLEQRERGSFLEWRRDLAK